MRVTVNHPPRNMSYLIDQSIYAPTAPGMVGQAEVIRRIHKAGFTTFEPTKEEDYEQDIDVWVGGATRETATPVSIKTIGNHYTNFAAEEYVFFPDGRKEESWFLKGKAKDYLILHRSKILWSTKERILTADSSGWRRTTLSPRQKEMQRKANHPHRDAQLLLIPLLDGVVFNVSSL